MTTKKKTVVRPKRLKTAESPSSEQKPEVYVSTEDRMTKLESAMESIAQGLERIETRQSESGKLPTAKSAEARIEAMQGAKLGGEPSHSTRVQDLINPRAQDSGFQMDDIVKVADTSNKYKHFLADAGGNPTDEEGEPALGVVMNYMYTKRNKQRKYKVKFPNFGTDGFEERELVLVRGV